MRTALVALMLLTPAIMLLAMILLYVPLRRFQRTTPILHTRNDIERLRRLAIVQMYGGLLSPLIWLPGIVWLMGKLTTDVVYWGDSLLYVVLPLAVVVGVSGLGQSTANAVRATHASDPKLVAERDRIVDIWLHGKWPKIPPGDF